MKKQDFVNAVHENVELEISRKLTGDVIDTTFSAISGLLNAETGKFTYPGFGTFAVKSRNERQGINPKTKQKITIPASNTVGFKPASAWKKDLTSKL